MYGIPIYHGTMTLLWLHYRLIMCNRNICWRNEKALCWNRITYIIIKINNHYNVYKCMLKTQTDIVSIRDTTMLSNENRVGSRWCQEGMFKGWSCWCCRNLSVFSAPALSRKPSRASRMFNLSAKSNPPPKVPQPERLDQIYEALKKGLQWVHRHTVLTAGLQCLNIGCSDWAGYFSWSSCSTFFNVFLF